MTKDQMRRLRRYVSQWFDDSKVFWDELSLEWRKTLASRHWYESETMGAHTYLYAHGLQYHKVGINAEVLICTSALIDFRLWMEIRHPNVTVDHVGYFPRYMDEALAVLKQEF